MTKQGHHSLPQQRPVLQPRALDLTSDLTFLSLRSTATLSKKTEQHCTSTYHVCNTSPSQGSLPCPGCADTSCTFSSPNKSSEKAHCPTCSKQILPAPHPKPVPPPPAEGAVPIILLQTACSCSSTAPWDNERDRVRTQQQQQRVRNLQDVPQSPAFPAPV